ncbi:thioesterase II family protein [Streptomyces sp. NPDC088760]|uniref:thioesterase II family protein n=1 Tax=Streptomyces sp. NPDC088760 TaxID=3365890 RepID=UPI003813FC12
MNSKWLKRFDTTTARGPRLVCFPHAGGAASSFLPLARELAPDVDVVAVQYPGRQERFDEPPVEDLGRLADHIAAALRPLTDGPYAVFGHSMGGLLAYETVRRLERWRLPEPSRLFVSGQVPPRDRRSDYGIAADDAEIVAELRALGGTAAVVLDDPDLMALVLPAVRADYRALRGYTWAPGPPLRCRISALVGDSDPVATAEAAAGWSAYSVAGADVTEFRGGHFYLEERLTEVAALIDATLGVHTG